MRYQVDHKEKTRSLVLAEAGKAIRKDGPHRVSVAAVMKRAGLTHGGFYAHFGSRDAMLVAAIEQMFDTSRDRWVRETLDRSPADGLSAYVDWYLSKAHRDAREAGCVIAALASDLPRLSAPCQKAYAEGARRIIGFLSAHLTTLRRPDPDDLARSVLAEMVGALSLARIEIEPRRSDAILAASRTSVKRRLGIGGAS
ncbi:MAG TPA: TetR/AcrR family transcriptional regulator [Kofleriaceae bacterium]|nr:TetR/AcrR family transcriptional regulator [Kofleriaceae bacterium]